MYLKITEANAWEQEKWSYVIDLSKQDGASIDLLMSFIKLANAQYEIDKKNVKSNPIVQPIRLPFPLNHGFVHPFASSFYTVNFFDSVKVTKNKLELISKDRTMSLSLNGGYKNNEYLPDKKISFRKIKSVRNAMRDKKENKLYKSFEDVFLK